MTRAGGRYHAERICSALADGHAKAANEGYPNHAAERMPLNQVRSGVSPCARCWPATSEWDDWKQLEHLTIRAGDSTFEYEFLHRVLKHVKGLEPYCVRVQHAITGSAGRNYRVDFAIIQPGGDKIAIEIDGFDKTASGNVATKEHQAADSARRNELQIAGWKILSFTNIQVQTDSGECRRKIENLLLSEPSRIQNSTSSSPSHEVRTAVSTNSSPPFRSPPAQTRPRTWSTGKVVGLVAAGIVVAWIAGTALVSSGDTGSDSTQPTGSECPAGYPVKGNVNDGGERIYHELGWRYYSSTWPEECFVTGEAAASAGYRESEVH